MINAPNKIAEVDGRAASEALYAAGRWRTDDGELPPRHALGPLGWLVWRTALRFARDAPPGLLLDVGGGEGYFAWRWPGSRRRLVVDVAFAPLAVARGRGLAVIQGDVRRLPLRTGAAALVVCSDVLEHLPAEAVPRALAELARVCRQDGLAVVHTSCYGFYLRRWLKRAPGHEPLDADDLKDGHLNRLPAATLAQAVREAGFSIANKIYYKHFFQPLIAALENFFKLKKLTGAEGGTKAKALALRNPIVRLANELRIAAAAWDAVVFGSWLPGGAVIYKLKR